MISGDAVHKTAADIHVPLDLSPIKVRHGREEPQNPEQAR